MSDAAQECFDYLRDPVEYCELLQHWPEGTEFFAASHTLFEEVTKKIALYMRRAGSRFTLNMTAPASGMYLMLRIRRGIEALNLRCDVTNAAVLIKASRRDVAVYLDSAGAHMRLVNAIVDELQRVQKNIAAKAKLILVPVS